MALAVSNNWVLQGVNYWFTLYSPSGALQSGWPKASQSFFGVPPAAGCGNSVYNPRAFYDAIDQRFWAAILNNVSPKGSCTTTLSRVWIAVSQTSNPNGLWNIYSFDVRRGSAYFGDFTQFGYDQQAVYVSLDMWTQPGGSGTFKYENVFALAKAPMEAGQMVTPYGFSGLTSGGVKANGVQPVEVEAYKGAGPPAGLFLSSYDYNSGGGDCVQGCSGLTVWAIAHPGTASQSLTKLVVPSASYAAPPKADQPGCTQCLGTLDPGINSALVWRNGQISFALSTAINNGTQPVAGIFWGQVGVSLTASGALTAASVAQSGYFSFSGDTSAFCPAVMTDVNGNLALVFTESSGSLYPGAYYAVRPVGYTAGQFPDGGLALGQGQASAPQPRWGDYSAAAVNGVGVHVIWLAGQYEAASQTWATSIGKINLGS
jgi:hypothetical protein